MYAGVCSEQPSNHTKFPSGRPALTANWCRRVLGLDATAARSFVTLHNKLQRMDIQLIITHIPAHCANICRLLSAQGLNLVHPHASNRACVASIPLLRPVPGAARKGKASKDPTCMCFPTMEAGVQHCEESFLQVAVAHGLCQPRGRRLSLDKVGGRCTCLSTTVKLLVSDSEPVFQLVAQASCTFPAALPRSA